MEYYSAKEVLIYKGITTTADILQYIIGDLYADGIEILRATIEQRNHYIDIQRQN